MSNFNAPQTAATLPAAGNLFATGFDTNNPAGGSPQQAAVTMAQLDAVAPTAITYAATITPDRSLGAVHTCTLTGNVTLANPTNLVAGQRIEIILTQDATGSRLLSAVGTLWKFPGGTKTLTTTANAVDCIKGVYDGTRILANLSLAYA